ncbi:ParA family protein [Kitasatospora sp. NPDC056076]|uniref:ParA family protein n=1 Tax=Kitasatospora sp. NPDC056076 TaxID=3345703 RepID=UPI0035E36FD9
MDTEIVFQDWRPTIRLPRTFLPIPTPGTEQIVIVVANQKGGAGKTTTVVELAAAFVAAGLTVRIIDGDPQLEGSLGDWMNPVLPEGTTLETMKSLFDVFKRTATLDEATYPTSVQGLYIVPSLLNLGMVETDNTLVGRETVLAMATKQSKLPVHVNIIDTPPALGNLLIAGLTAANTAIVPLSIGGLDSKAMASLNRTISLVQTIHNPDLRVRGIVLTAWEKNKLARDIGEQLSLDYPDAVILPARKSVRTAEAPLTNTPTRVYDPEGQTASDFDQLAQILLANLPRQKSRR